MPKGEKLAEYNRKRASAMLRAQLTKYTEDANTGCWLWAGGVSEDGYGKLKREGRTLRAHRFFYEQFVGTIPKGFVVCHRCDTPLCVNPKHLFVGTHLDNERDKDAKGRRSPSPGVTHRHTLRRGVSHHKAKLSDDAVREIRAGQLPTLYYARKYEVSMSTIQRAKARKNWSHL